MVPLQLPLFPIDQPVMPEDRQIGRSGDVLALHQRFDAAVHQWIVGPRRIGKTSVARATLARWRRAGGVALDLDLSRGELSTADDVARVLAQQGLAAGVGNLDAGVQMVDVARAGEGFAAALRTLGYDDPSTALDAASALLSSGGEERTPRLSEVLEALAVHATVTERRVVLLLDEVHRLAAMDGAEAEIARWASAELSPLVFLLCGSEESAVAALREPGRPLAGVGQEHRLPDITTVAWLQGLVERFAEAGIEIREQAVLELLETSDGHPRRTMLIATYVHQAALARDDRVATRDLVRFACADARHDRSWA